MPGRASMATKAEPRLRAFVDGHQKTVLSSVFFWLQAPNDGCRTDWAVARLSNTRPNFLQLVIKGVPLIHISFLLKQNDHSWKFWHLLLNKLLFNNRLVVARYYSLLGECCCNSCGEIKRNYWSCKNNVILRRRRYLWNRNRESILLSFWLNTLCLQVIFLDPLLMAL